ncbi:DUF7518 family protein [Halorientalis sp.]|jgi:hypothetical protein|uniref:DUF7518 family protein n=1 Tax=Halorientalis sp. TaxID=1931229 RepID=UPI002620F2A6|nr:bZIP transcription factor [Halorientalis sp.]
MASGNRVEELESRVNELEATVDGLTDELVECKVRIRELENVVDAEVGLDTIDGSGVGSSTPPGERSTDGTAPVSEPQPEPTADAERAEAPKSEGTEAEDETESEGSDIIVA